jgi:hypothetical protein
MKTDNSGEGKTVTVTPSTIARMAGNIAAGLVTLDNYNDISIVAKDAVAIAHAIVDELNKELQ